MRIDTLTCSECGSIVAGNVLESDRIVPCPNSNCQEIFRFDDLSEDAQENLINNRGSYRAS